MGGEVNGRGRESESERWGWRERRRKGTKCYHCCLSEDGAEIITTDIAATP